MFQDSSALVTEARPPVDGIQPAGGGSEQSFLLEATAGVADRCLRPSWAGEWEPGESLGHQNGVYVPQMTELKPGAGGWGGLAGHTESREQSWGCSRRLSD